MKVLDFWAQGESLLRLYQRFQVTPDDITKTQVSVHVRNLYLRTN